MADGWGGGSPAGSGLPGQELLRHTMNEMEERQPPQSVVHDDPERPMSTKLRWFLWTAGIVVAIIVASFFFR
jgi:hypothetical protein